MDLAKLDALSLGFRSHYLDFDALTRQLHSWAEAFPSFVRLGSIGQSREGRELWLLTLGVDPERLRPAAWLDGNIHACEVAGSSVALAIAEDLLRAHLGAPVHDLPAHVLEWLRSDVLFYVLPRMCPDGAELMLKTGRWVRSNPRDERDARATPYWRLDDVDGDGRVLMMRRRDPAGDYVESGELPNLMLPRRIEDDGPAYCLYPEGFIEHFDGLTVPEPDYLSDNAVDMNRNFPSSWQPEPEQKGAGAFATSEPEARAVSEFAARHPNIFAWLALHTYGGVYIRPCGDKPDKRMAQSDLAVFRQIEEWGERITGYPSVSGYEEFTYEPDKPLRGELSSYAYEQRGAVALVCELWDFYQQAGLPRLRPFVHNYQRRTRDEALTMARWDREHNHGRVLGSWRRATHPQLGEVEVGGYDPRVGVWNPPYERLAEVCAQQARVFLRIAALAPRLRVSVSVETLDGGHARIAAVVENLGYLPSYVLASAKGFPWNEPVHARLTLDGATLVAGERERTLGHLGGWGGYDKSSTPAHPGAWTSGEPVRRRAEWVVRGAGRVTVTAGSPRCGEVEASVEL